MNLPGDAIRLTFDYLDDESLAYACMLNKYFNAKICNDYYWLNKISNKYHLSRDIIDKYRKNNTYWAYYYELSRRFEDYDFNNISDMNEMLLLGTKLGRLDIILITLRNGATAINHALILASINDKYEIVKYFIEQGADVNSYAGQALFFAVANENVEIVELLLKSGANPNEEDGAIMKIGDRYNNDDIMELLYHYGGSPEYL
jgi:ankyrin repeat protein